MTATAPSELPKRYDLTTAAHDYPAWKGVPKRSVLVCTMPRSGSTLLGEALYFAGGLGCPLEYFHAGFRPSIAERWDTPDLPGYVAAIHRWRTDPSGVFATKMFWVDMTSMAAELDPARFAKIGEAGPDDVSPETYRALADVLASAFPNPNYVHLERRDRIRRAVSGLTAFHTQVFRQIPEDGLRSGATPVEYDFNRIDELVAFSDYCHAHWRNYFAAIGASPYPVAYESLSGDYVGTIERLLRHLGSDAPVPRVRMQRQGGSGNESFVLRYLRENHERMASAAGDR